MHPACRPAAIEILSSTQRRAGVIERRGRVLCDRRDALAATLDEASSKLDLVGPAIAYQERYGEPELAASMREERERLRQIVDRVVGRIDEINLELTMLEDAHRLLGKRSMRLQVELKSCATWTGWRRRPQRSAA